jgi:hypothetical protein
MLIKVITARNKKYNGLVFGLGDIDNVGPHRITFKTPLILNGKAYTVTLSPANKDCQHDHVQLNIIGGKNHGTIGFSHVQIIERHKYINS